ncbi:putative sulfate transporter/MT1781 [Roseovarius gaetbuli]|uniref:Putative sulfate transporter/MT1781 n=1 Tax=Roseovarius gaetbuli TaxID=1356575 RepID=A0A1X6Y9K5_9RHOB|nr:SulP family inorganic anion transporter [Roseovarius gaetbuli]SLN14854.1 putative sulfate transporter/MT1781 [Roseovarius gaetbuli]
MTWRFGQPADEAPHLLPSNSKQKLTARERLRAMMPFLEWLPLVNKRTFRADVFAGITNAAIVLPQGIAFAAIAGLPPQYGLYTAMVTPVIAALFGSSWHLVSGPTTAISVVIFATLSESFTPGSPEFISAVFSITLLAGFFQLCLGLVNLGQLVSLVSHSVMVGFTAGAAILIFLSQLPGFIGKSLPRPDDLVELGQELWRVLPDLNPHVLAVSVTTLVAAVVVKRYRPMWPNYLIALVVGSGLAFVLNSGAHGVAFVEAIDSGIPPVAVPEMSFEIVRTMSQGAFALALIGLLEAVSIARAMSLQSHQSLNSNQEIIGQGLSNIGGSFFSAYMGSGSFTRSSLNLEAGAKTPLAAILAAIFLLVILLLVSPLIAHIPIPAMSGLIMLVAWKLIDIREIRHILTTSPSETSIFLVTFITVLLVDLEFAIYAGVIVSLALFLRQTMKPGLPVNVPNGEVEGRPFMSPIHWRLPECPQAVFLRVQGPMYFGAVEYLEKEFVRLAKQRPGQKHLCLLIDGAVGIDLAGAEWLVEESRNRTDMGGSLSLVGRYPPLRRQLDQFHVTKRIGKAHIFRRKREMLETIVPRLDRSICANCTARVFLECKAMPGPPSDAPDDAQAPAAPDPAPK